MKKVEEKDEQKFKQCIVPATSHGRFNFHSNHDFQENQFAEALLSDHKNHQKKPERSQQKMTKKMTRNQQKSHQKKFLHHREKSREFKKRTTKASRIRSRTRPQIQTELSTSVISPSFSSRFHFSAFRTQRGAINGRIVNWFLICTPSPS